MKPATVDTATTGKKLLEIVEEPTHKPVPDVGVQVNIELDSLKKNGLISEEKFKKFNSDCHRFLEAASKKLTERSPLSHAVVTYVCFYFCMFYCIYITYTYLTRHDVLIHN
jgi:hypothetical protein